MKLGLISDIHEDIKRLKQALDVLKSRKCDRIVCLGDMVGYSVPYYGFLRSRNASEVIKLVRENCDIVVIGNHDLYAIKKTPEHQAGFEYPRNWYALDYGKRKLLSEEKVWLYEGNELSALLTKADKEYLDSLPEYIVDDFDGVKILFSHYAYPDLVGATKFEPQNPIDVDDHFAFMKKHGCVLGISGHDHKEGAMIFTPDKVAEIPFGKTSIDRNIPIWVHIPGVVNGSYANGVAIFDTATFDLETVPLNSEKHILPEWRKL